MKRLVARMKFAGLLLGVLAGSGCTMCKSEWYEAYSAYGGSWERSDPFHGRVGSAFAPAGTRVEAAVSDSQPAAPTPAEPAPVPPATSPLTPPPVPTSFR